MLKHRVLSGFSMGGALLAALYFLPPEGAIILVALLCGISILEFYALLEQGGMKAQKWTGVAGSLALLVLGWLHVYFAGDANTELELMVIFVTLAVVMIRQMFLGDIASAARSIAATMLGVLYIGILFHFMSKLLLYAGIADGRWHEGRWLFFYLALVVKLTDVGAYFTGCRLGGRKFFPSISPAKTWSGVLGGMATGMVCSLAGWSLMQGNMIHVQLTWVDALALGLLLSAAGITGDLIESMLKRACGVKDSGTVIKGMGGVLDVVDSLIFAAPVLYIYLNLFAPVLP